MIRYHRDLPLDAPPDVVVETEAHVRAHLSAVADADDDPTTRAAEVTVERTLHPGQCLRIAGALDAEPTAPYLQDGHDPYAGVPAELRAEVDR